MTIQISIRLYPSVYLFWSKTKHQTPRAADECGGSHGDELLALDSLVRALLLGDLALVSRGSHELLTSGLARVRRSLTHGRCSLYWMKDVTKSDLRKRNTLDRKYLTDDEIDSIHLANISRTSLARFCVLIVVPH